MAAQQEPLRVGSDTDAEKKGAEGESGFPAREDASSVHSGEDILSMQDLDPALNMKMHLVNNVRDYCDLPEATSFAFIGG